MKYEGPEEFGVSLSGVSQEVFNWALREFRRIGNSLAFGVETEHLSLRELNAAPGRAPEGIIVWADGTNWNPGSGAGLYQRRAGVWEPLGGGGSGAGMTHPQVLARTMGA